MPMITVRYVTPSPRPELRADVARFATRLGAEQLGKDPNVTAVLVEEADPQSWLIAGKRPTEDGLSAFWLDIKITAGTNTKADTVAFVNAAFAGMQELIGPLHEECSCTPWTATLTAMADALRTAGGPQRTPDSRSRQRTLRPIAEISVKRREETEPPTR